MHTLTPHTLTPPSYPMRHTPLSHSHPHLIKPHPHTHHFSLTRSLTHPNTHPPTHSLIAASLDKLLLGHHPHHRLLPSFLPWSNLNSTVNFKKTTILNSKIISYSVNSVPLLSLLKCTRRSTSRGGNVLKMSADKTLFRCCCFDEWGTTHKAGVLSTRSRVRVPGTGL